MGLITLPPDTRTDGEGNPPEDMDLVVDALNAMGATFYVQPSGDTTGTTDPSNLNTALAAAPPGSFVVATAGDWYLKSPVLIPPVVTFTGQRGGIAAGDVNTATPKGTVFHVVAGFTGLTVTLASGDVWSSTSTNSITASAAIALLDCAAGGWTAYNTSNAPGAAVGSILRDFMVDGTSSPSGADAIAGFGAVYATRLQGISVNNITGNGIVGYPWHTSGGTYYQPDGWHGRDVLAQNIGLDSFGQFIWNDCTFYDFHAQGQNGGGTYTNCGFNINQPSVRLFNCRAEFKQTAFLVSPGGASTSTSAYAPVILSGCTSDQADQNGCWIYNPGTGDQAPVIITGCQFDAAGQNAGAGGGGYAGIRVTGKHAKVTISSTNVLPGGSTAGPAYGLVIEQYSTGNAPDYVAVTGGTLCGVTAAVSQDGTAVATYIDASVQQATGTPAGGYTYTSKGKALWNGDTDLYRTGQGILATDENLQAASGYMLAERMLVSGITGATASSRYVGAVAGGNPASGTFNTGDFIIDTVTGLVRVCTSGGTSGTWAGGSGQYLCAPNVYAPGSQTTVSLTTTTLAAFDTGVICTKSFTAPPSGDVVVALSCVLQVSASGANVALALAATGTVTPVIGNVYSPQISGTTTAAPVHPLFYITGLTPGTSYQLDLLGACTSGDTVSILAFGSTATSLGVKGAPVVMTVQAV